LAGDRAAFVLGDRLWLTDGTGQGTLPGPAFDSVATLTGFGDRILAAGARHGAKGLWSLDESGNTTDLAQISVPDRIDVLDGYGYFAGDDPQHGLEPWITDGTAAGTHPLGDISPGPGSSNPGRGGLEPTGFVAAGGLVYFAADDAVHDVELWAVAVEEPAAAPTCVPDGESLCLRNGRFRVEVAWRDFAGRVGQGHAIPQTSDTGSFWFFAEANYELTVKVLDGRRINGHYWVFHGSLTNVEYTLTVTDTETDQVWTHTNPLRHFGSGGDVRAFPEAP
jgi:ELWxxDGT repeat protein